MNYVELYFTLKVWGAFAGVGILGIVFAFALWQALVPKR